MKLSNPTSLPTTSGKLLGLTTNILVIGGSFAGLSAIKALKNNLVERIGASKTNGKDTTKRISITLIEPRAGFLNILSMPKAVVDQEFAKTQFIPFHQLQNFTFDHVISPDKEVCDAIAKRHSESQNQPNSNSEVGLEFTYVQGKVNELSEKAAKYTLVGGRNGESPQESQTISFDYVVLAAGRDRSWPITPNAYNFDSFMGEMKRARDEFASAEKISIIGAGAVGIELSSEIKHHFPEKTVNLIHPHKTFPAEPLSDEFKSAVKNAVANAGVSIHLSTRVAKELPSGDLVTTDNKVIESNFNQWCTSHKNNTHVLAPALQKQFVNSKNNVVTNDYLQLVNDETNLGNVFVIGDLVELPVIKSAGWALYMGRNVANNITSLIFDNKVVEPLSLRKPSGMVIVGGNGGTVSEQGGYVELNNPRSVQHYKDYCMGRARAKLGL